MTTTDYLPPFTVEDASDDYGEPNYFIHDANGQQVGDNIPDEVEARRRCRELNEQALSADKRD